MLKLIKYFKPFRFLILLIIVLLLTQAFCDLALPDYMSNIVNNGIQQGGLVDAVPKAMRRSEADKLAMLMSEEDKNAFLNSYLLYKPGDETQINYKKFVSDYPALLTEEVVVLKTDDKDAIDTLNRIVAKPILILYALSEKKLDNFGVQAIDIPQGDILKALEMIPKEQLDVILSRMNNMLSNMPESMINQSAIEYIKKEYQALGVNMEKLQESYLVKSGILMILVALLSVAATIAVGFLSSRVSAGLTRDLRSDIFRKVESYSSAEFDKYSAASLITRTTNDVQQIQMFVLMLLRIIIYAPILGIGGVLKVVSARTNMSWVIAVSVAVIMFIVAIMFSVAIPKFKIVQKLIDRLNLVTRERLTGLLVIRAFNTQKHEEERFDNANTDLTGVNLFINRTMSLMMPLMMLVMNCVSLLVVWVGSHQVDAGTMQVGDMMAFISYTMQIIMSFLMISMVSIMLPRASVSAQRISEALEVEPSIKDPEVPAQFNPSLKGTVEFRDVSFRYPGAEEDALSNISFTARQGQTIAFIGSTGSGKSTLVNLIPRFYDVTKGSVLVDGTDVREVTQHDLRERIGYVPQKGVLFSGTIESNLLYGNIDATEEELKKALEIAQAWDFVSEKPQGLNEPIAQGGTNVSGGQKQRLSIARALVRKPEIFIFDDSFSALDFKTDSQLRKALKETTGDSTVLIVAQRINTIMNADMIIVLENGRIAGMGKHKELLETCSVYREIASSQLSKEELA